MAATNGTIAVTNWTMAATDGAMPANDPVFVVEGFSLLSRWLLYASMMLTPAQFASGIGSNCLSNFGYLAYNFYTQIQWFRTTRKRELHALSLLLNNFNTLYFITYLGGVSSSNCFIRLLLASGTAVVIVLNNLTAWVAWATNMREGYGVYQFFFFGWRTLNQGWHMFLGAWAFGASIFTLICVVVAFKIAISPPLNEKHFHWKFLFSANKKSKFRQKYLSPYINAPSKREYHWTDLYLLIPAGAVFTLLLSWPIILWSELIIQRNNIQSETDWVAVWLFVAQVFALLIPASCWK